MSGNDQNENLSASADINPELDQLKGATHNALEELRGHQDFANVFLGKALEGLEKDLIELGVDDPSKREAFKMEYVRRFKEETVDLEEQAIAESIEKKNWDHFVDHYAKYPPLDKLIQEAKEEGSGDAIERWARRLKRESPGLAETISTAISLIAMFTPPPKEGEAPSLFNVKLAELGQILSGEEQKETQPGEQANAQAATAPAEGTNPAPNDEMAQAEAAETDDKTDENLKQKYLDALTEIESEKQPTIFDLMKTVADPNSLGIFEGNSEEPDNNIAARSDDRWLAINDYLTEKLGMDGFRFQITPDGITIIRLDDESNQIAFNIQQNEDGTGAIFDPEDADDKKSFDGKLPSLAEAIGELV